MTRISLTEDYDDRNVISKLKNMNDKLDSALVDTQEAVTSAREASANAQTASDAARASAHSASESAEIVAGYDSRLDTAEQEINDVKDYAEAIGDDVSAIDTEIHTTRPYMTTNTEQTITAKKHIPTATVNDDSDVWVNKAFVQATDGRNNLVHNIGDEKIDGLKEFSHVENFPILHNINGVNTMRGTYKVFEIPYKVADHIEFEISSGANNDKFIYIVGSVRCYPTAWARGTVYLHKGNVGFTPSSMKWKIENNVLSVYLVVDWDYLRCNVRIKSVSNYGAYYKTSNPPVFTYGNEQVVTVSDTHDFIEG